MGSLIRWFKRTFDNRVLAPRAYIATDFASGAQVAYLPPAMYDDLRQKAVPSQSWNPGQFSLLSGSFGMPVYRMSESMDKRDNEQGWREGKHRV